jgi:hypothetical protein
VDEFEDWLVSKIPVEVITDSPVVEEQDSPPGPLLADLQAEESQTRSDSSETVIWGGPWMATPWVAIPSPSSSESSESCTLCPPKDFVTPRWGELPHLVQLTWGRRGGGLG